MRNNGNGNGSLTVEQIERIKRIYEALADVMNTSSIDMAMKCYSLASDIEGTISDQEKIAKVYEYFCRSKNRTVEAKREALQMLLMRSTMPAKKVLKKDLKNLSGDDAIYLMLLCERYHQAR